MMASLRSRNRWPQIGRKAWNKCSSNPRPQLDDLTVLDLRTILTINGNVFGLNAAVVWSCFLSSRLSEDAHETHVGVKLSQIESFWIKAHDGWNVIYIIYVTASWWDEWLDNSQTHNYYCDYPCYYKYTKRMHIMIFNGQSLQPLWSCLWTRRWVWGCTRRNVKEKSHKSTKSDKASAPGHHCHHNWMGRMTCRFSDT